MTISARTTVLFCLGLLVAQGIVLFTFGQPAICECGEVKVWEGVVKSSGNSQHLTDWYTPSHLLHGILFFALLSWLFPGRSIWWRLVVATILEVGWEILENTPMVIDHYRKQALAQGYVGDSIINSIFDTIAMIGGYFLAQRLPIWLSIAIVVGFEALTIYFIRDGLFLNIINLIYPFAFISSWQSGG